MSIHTYPHPVDPEVYPEYTRRRIKAVTRADLEDRIQFTALRVFTIRDNKLVGFIDDLDTYTRRLRIGNIIWPFCSALYASNFRDLVDEVKRRGLWLFDFWGYVPGSDPSAQFWGQYQPPREAVEYMRETLGPHFLGMDNGEQDGRYIGGYAPLMCPASPDRARQYENFARYFEALGDDMHHQLSVLCSLNYGHYFAKEADSTILGEESGQALPNVNVWFSYLRGASRQYGILTFGNASIWNRWGYKSYESEGKDGGVEWGPSCGTSLSLLKRLLYTEYLYGCEIIGFEQSWILNDNVEKRLKGEHVPMQDDPAGARLSPVGELQVGAVDFVARNGRPGVLHTPVALFMDFHNGWTFPRHLYTREIYKVWGNRAYEAGDYQVDALFSMLYPGYEDAGFFRDERGFVTATPYGDSVDVLFSDVRLEVLASYGTAIVAGEIVLDLEGADKLRRFAESGGHVVISTAQLPRSSEGLELLGVREVLAPLALAAGTRSSYLGGAFTEPAFHLTSLRTAGPAEVLAVLDDGSRPLVQRLRLGRGKIDVICVPFGLADLPAQKVEADNSPDKAIPHPARLLAAVRAYLHGVLDASMLLDVGNPGLQFCVAVAPGRDGERSLTISVSNNTVEAQGFTLHPRSGSLRGTEELEISAPGTETAGYHPSSVTTRPTAQARPKPELIEPGEVRVFRGTLQGAELAEYAALRFTDESRGAALSVRRPESLRSFVHAHPTLLEHVDTLKIDAEYLQRAEIEVLRSEGAFLGRLGCGVIVDLRGLLNFYPQLTLIDNIGSRWQASLGAIRSILDKAVALGAKSVLLSLHRNAENAFSTEQAERSFRANLGVLAGEASSRSLHLHLEHNPFRRFRPTMKETLEILRDIGSPSLRPALNLGHALASGEDAASFLAGTELVLVSAPILDRWGQFTDAHAPVAGSPFAGKLRELWRAARRERSRMVCLDSVYPDWDAVYRDFAYLRGVAVECAMLDYDLVTAKAAYRTLTPKDAEAFAALVERFHAEIGTRRQEGRRKTLATIRELDRNKRALSIFVIERGSEAVGYSIVVTRWDNERGGNVLCVDELYVLPAHRGLGIATDFVELLAKIAPSGAVAIEIRVPLTNRRAAARSRRMGYDEPWYRTAVREIGAGGARVDGAHVPPA